MDLSKFDRTDAILACLRHQDGVRREDIGRYLEQMGSACSKTTLVRELHAMSGLGLVERSGTGRDVRYALSRNSIQTMPVDVAAYFSKDADDGRDDATKAGEGCLPGLLYPGRFREP